MAILAVVACFAGYQIRRRRTLRRALAAREPVPAAEFGARHYADPAAATVGSFLVVQLQELTGRDLTGVVPGDRIIGDLHIDELDSLAAVEVIAAVERRFGVSISDEEASRTRTVGEFVELVTGKMKGR